MATAQEAMQQVTAFQRSIEDATHAAITGAAVDLAEKYGVEDLIQQLDDLPWEIENQKQLVVNAKQQLDDAEQNLKQVEGVLMAAVTATTGDDGKKRYSNKQARQTAMEEWKQNDDEYQHAKKERDEAEVNYRNARAKLERFQDVFMARRKITELVTAQLHAISG